MRQTTGVPPVAPPPPGSGTSHTAAAMAASMKAAPAEQLSARTVPRLDRDIHTHPRNIFDGVSHTGAYIASCSRARSVSHSKAAPRSPALPPAPESVTSDGRSTFLGCYEDAQPQAQAGSTGVRRAPSARAGERRGHPAQRIPAYRFDSLPLSPEPAVNNYHNPYISRAENEQGNSFAGSAICSECTLPFTDSNYAATTFEGHSYCGDCWDAYLGVTLVFASNRHPSTLCGCGRDLQAEPWFAVDLAAHQTPYCRACSLSYWGMSGSDFAVTIFKDEGNAMEASRGVFSGSRGLQQRTLSAAIHLPGLLQWSLSLLTHECVLENRIEVGLAPDPKVFYTKRSCLCTRYRGRLRPKGIYVIPKVYILYQSSCLCTRYNARAYARASIS